MRQQLVYDLPMRIFHWLFAGLFLTAFVIAKTIDDDSPVYSFHMLAGISLSFLVILRIAWGFWGTRHARFSGFALNPKDLVGYLKGLFSGSKRRWPGHNPAASWAAVTMMAMALGLGATGYLMATGPDKEAFEDVHELLANGFIIVVVLHLAGILLHTIRHQDMIGLSMIDGKKADIPKDQAIASPRSAMGILLVGLVVAFGLHLFNNYDGQNQNLQLFGATLQLGDTEDGEQGENDEAGDDDDDGDDD